MRLNCNRLKSPPNSNVIHRAKDYADPLAKLLLLIGKLLVTLQLKEDKGSQADALVATIWSRLRR